MDGGWSEWTEWNGQCSVQCHQLDRMIKLRGHQVIPTLSRRSDIQRNMRVNDYSDDGVIILLLSMGDCLVQEMMRWNFFLFS